MIVVALGCKKGVGKTTVARMMRDVAGFQILSFGEAVREMAVERYKFDINLTRTEEGKSQMILHPDLPNGMAEVRKILQIVGGGEREKTPSYWDDIIFDKLYKIHKQDRDAKVVIDDLRHPTEKIGLEALFRATSYRIRPFAGWRGGDSHAQHYSEVALDDCADWVYEFTPMQGIPYLRSVATAILNYVNVYADWSKFNTDRGQK